MDLFDFLLIGVGVSMDAFSAAICKGLSVKRITLMHMLIVGLYFGIFQGLMPVIGYLAGVNFSGMIQKWDHWIAFILLGILGIQMIKEAIECEECPIGDFTYRSMIPLAIATSIDALAVGVTFAFLHVNILHAALIIGGFTFLMSALGVRLGNGFGQKFQKPAQIAGGVILIGIGAKILIEHTLA